MSRVFLSGALALCFLLASCVGSMPAAPSGTAGAPPSLPGTEWLLEDLGGAGVLDRGQATLGFLDATRASGSGSCNRFTGVYELSGNAIKFGPLATTRRACVPAVMNQEDKYLAALQSAERMATDGPYLLIYSKGMEKPLRFTRMTTPKPGQ